MTEQSSEQGNSNVNEACASAREDIDSVVLVNGVMAFEVEKLCRDLKRAGIQFSLFTVDSRESGVINARPDNVASAITNISNAFSNGGLTTCYQILVPAEDYERARKVAGIEVSEGVPFDEPPPESAFTDAEPEPKHDIGPKGIWGWNTIPILNLVFLVGSALWNAATMHFPGFFNGTMWAFWENGCETYNFSLGIFISIELAYNLMLASLAVYTLILVFKRSSSYPGLATKLFWISAVGLGVDLVAANYFDIEIPDKAKQSVFRAVVFAMIWMAYFSKSIRIKNTFVGAPANWRKVCCAPLIAIAISAAFCWVGMSSNKSVPVKTFVCELQTREVAGHEAVNIGCKGMVSDAFFAEKAGEIELRLKAVMRQFGSDDVEVVLNDQDNIILTYSLNVGVADAALQKAIDDAGLPISLDLVNQRQYIAEEKSK